MKCTTTYINSNIKNVYIHISLGHSHTYLSIHEYINKQSENICRKGIVFVLERVRKGI